MKPGSLIYETAKDALIYELLNQTELQNHKENCEFLGYIETIPNGPSLTGVTLEFIHEEELEFIPKYIGLCTRIADTLDLQPTKKLALEESKEEEERLAEPYRLFNFDHFDDRYQNLSLYGSCPFIFSVEKESSTGFVMLNA